jgi:hypothetical protein
MEKIKMKRLFNEILLLILSVSAFFGCSVKSNDEIIFVCSEENDLYHATVESYGEFPRFSSAEKAIDAAAEGTGIFVLADNYPAEKVVLPDGFFKAAESKNIKLYIEFPDSLPGIKTGDIQKTEWERAVISSNVFDESLKKMRILTINDCHYVHVEADTPHIVMAKVAGFDTAVYGLDSTETHPILFEIPETDILVSTTKLSQFITGRYAPKDAWKSIWDFVLNWLQPDGAFPELKWTESVRPSYPKDKTLIQDERAQAAKRGVEWYYKSNLLATSLQVKFGEKLTVTTDGEYGTEGIRECYLSKIHFDGSQDTREERRADCASESAMALAIRGMLDKNVIYKATAENLQDFVYFKSRMRQGPRNDPQNAQFGFINWDNREDIKDGVYYADDNARVVMGTLATSAALKTDRWDEGVVANILANFRATSPTTGFKPRRLESGPLNRLGWEHYRDAEDYFHFAPHYQSWIMAMYLWLYDKTGYEPLFTVAKTGITNLMKTYPHEWRWTNGLQQERARMILPLAWLLRIENTFEHREWLNQMVDDLLSFQDECGAIREDLGKAGYGAYGPPKTNADYGTNEAPLIQENGDPVADLLYTSNFAFFSLTEAAAVTGDKKIKDAVNKLADFMVKIQVRSDSRPELDGAWFRAFDYNKWEYWGSNSDLGWGVWSTETGWTQGWITTMLMMQEMNTNFWDFTAGGNIVDCFGKYKEMMLDEQK